jgi:DNA-binding NarL/FixJ family response regulator
MSIGVRVAVASDQRLIAESVRAALVDRGYDAVLLRWPELAPSGQPGRWHRRGTSRRPRPGPLPSVGLMLSDLDQLERIRAARALLEGLVVPWLVLTGAPPGPEWGAIYERGAKLVMPTSITLGAVGGLLDDLAAGHQPARPRHRQRLIRDWRSSAQELDVIASRIDTLTSREAQVLRLLYAGVTVGEIAEQSEVSVATVRSQVKAILRKLHVSSQLAAVAAFDQAQDESGPAGQDPSSPSAPAT